METWRDIARPIIADVIRGCGYPKGCDKAFIRKALRGTYPFGMRKYHPYRVWCDEVRRQLDSAERRAAKNFKPAQAGDQGDLFA